MTTSDGYLATVSYTYTGSKWTADPSRSKPGQTELTGTFQGTATVTNKTPQRQNPKYYLASIVGLYGADSPVCQIGPTMEYLEGASGGTRQYCAVTLGYLPMNQNIDMIPAGGSIKAAKIALDAISGLDESIAPKVIASLQKPALVVATIRVPDTTAKADNITVSGLNCHFSAQNSASKNWDDGGIWVVPPGQTDACGT